MTPYEQEIYALQREIEQFLPHGMPVEPASHIIGMARTHNQHPSFLLNEVEETTRFLTTMGKPSTNLGLYVTSIMLNTEIGVGHVCAAVGRITDHPTVPENKAARILNTAAESGLPIEALEDCFIRAEQLTPEILDKETSLKSIALGLKYNRGASDVQLDFLDLWEYITHINYSIGADSKTAWAALEIAYATGITSQKVYNRVLCEATTRLPAQDAFALMLVAATTQSLS
jgi:hypothetical protein